MNGAAAVVGGRQMQRPGHHHQRQYSSDHFFLDSVATGAGGGGAGNKWLQSAGLHHLQSSSLTSAQQVTRSPFTHRDLVETGGFGSFYFWRLNLFGVAGGVGGILEAAAEHAEGGVLALRGALDAAVELAVFQPAEEWGWCVAERAQSWDLGYPLLRHRASPRSKKVLPFSSRSSFLPLKDPR